jgi:hypothetical protein
MMVDYAISESWEDVIQEQPLSRISSVTSVGSRKTKPSSASQSPSSNHGFNTDSFEQVTQSSEDDITQQVTRRLGRMCLAEDGHMRYYGATSHFSMLPNDLRTFYPTDTRSLREEGETMIQRAHLGWIRDHEYELHLTALYFAWHNTFVNEVRKDVYFHEKELYYSGYDTPLFSPALENAMSVNTNVVPRYLLTWPPVLQSALCIRQDSIPPFRKVRQTFLVRGPDYTSKWRWIARR